MSEAKFSVVHFPERLSVGARMGRMSGHIAITPWFTMPETEDARERASEVVTTFCPWYQRSTAVLKPAEEPNYRADQDLALQIEGGELDVLTGVLLDELYIAGAHYPTPVPQDVNLRFRGKVDRPILEEGMVWEVEDLQLLFRYGYTEVISWGKLKH